MKTRILLFWVLLISQYSYSQVSIPKYSDPIVTHNYYSLGYNEEHEQASWVFYKLYSDLVDGAAERKDKFKADPFVGTGSASLSDYRGSGYDRGHLCAAADMKINDLAMAETFYMSNMSPQIASFNRGIWKELEADVRDWVEEGDTIYVATAAIFKDNKGTIGQNEVTIPGYYYKVLYRIKNDKKPAAMIGFILPHEKSDREVESFIVSVDRVEEATGIDFFSGVDDERSLEAEIGSFD